MFDWLPEVCRDLRGSLVDLYWLLLVPYVVLMVCLEFFRLPDQPVPGRILKRAVISMLLLFSFEQCMKMLAMVSDGIVERVNGVSQLKDLLVHLKDNYMSMEISWLHAREALLYIISLFSYIVAYLGVFVADILIHFVWAILYVVSPLMILMYVSERTAFVTGNLYKGLINVLTWKVFWSILGVLLLKTATTPELASSDNFLMAVLMNLCIGLCMLFVPFATKSLLTSGLEGAASALAGVPAAAAAGAIKLYTIKYGKKAIKEPFTGFQGTRNLYSKVRSGVTRGGELVKGTGHWPRILPKRRVNMVSATHEKRSTRLTNAAAPSARQAPFATGFSRARKMTQNEIEVTNL